MAKGSNRNYKVGPKNNWRRTIWNEVLARTAGREQTELVLYLAGPQDLDREIAEEKGVPRQNLVAIDKSLANVTMVRSGKGAPAIQADIYEVLSSWPNDRRVCAVLLDFCCGLELKAIGVYDTLERPALRSAVVMVNFMRGRDPLTNAIRARLTDPDSYPMSPVHMIGGESTFYLSEKHRALQFLSLHAIELWQALERQHGLAALGAVGISLDSARAVELGFSADEQSELMRSAWMVFANRIFVALSPRFFSYKSGSLTFDSAVFVSHASGFDDPRMPQSIASTYDLVVASKHQSDIGTARKISAMLAVRTRRLATA